MFSSIKGLQLVYQSLRKLLKDHQTVSGKMIKLLRKFQNILPDSVRRYCLFRKDWFMRDYVESLKFSLLCPSTSLNPDLVKKCCIEQRKEQWFLLIFHTGIHKRVSLSLWWYLFECWFDEIFWILSVLKISLEFFKWSLEAVIVGYYSSLSFRLLSLYFLGGWHEEKWKNWWTSVDWMCMSVGRELSTFLTLSHPEKTHLH